MSLNLAATVIASFKDNSSPRLNIPRFSVAINPKNSATFSALVVPLSLSSLSYTSFINLESMRLPASLKNFSAALRVEESRSPKGISVLNCVCPAAFNCFFNAVCRFWARTFAKLITLPSFLCTFTYNASGATKCSGWKALPSFLTSINWTAPVTFTCAGSSPQALVSLTTLPLANATSACIGLPLSSIALNTVSEFTFLICGRDSLVPLKMSILLRYSSAGNVA